MYYRLSLLMFLQYAIPGAWIPVLSLRLEEELGFTPVETAWAYATWAVSAVVASLVAGQVADRWVSIERCVAFCAALVTVLMFVMADCTSAAAVCGLSLAACLFTVPILTLGVTLCLVNMTNPERDFGRVRLWGTVGWIASGLLLGLWLRAPHWWPGLPSWLPVPSFADSMRLGGLAALLLAGYALTLPHTPPLRRGRHWLAPLGALHLLRLRPFLVFTLCSFLVHVTIPFHTQQSPLVLRQLGLPREWVSPAATVGQWSEIVMLGLLPVLTTRLSVRATLLVGLLAWLTALALLAVGHPAWLVLAALSLNGVFIGCYAVRGQVFVNETAGDGVRASAQGLITMTNGAGMLLGNFLVGGVREWTGHRFGPTFAVGVAVCAAALVVFLVGLYRRVPAPVLVRGDATAAPAVPVLLTGRTPERVAAPAAAQKV